MKVNRTDFLPRFVEQRGAGRPLVFKKGSPVRCAKTGLAASSTFEGLPPRLAVGADNGLHLGTAFMHASGHRTPTGLQEIRRRFGGFFQPGDGNLITRFDRGVIGLVGGASAVFQEATGVTQKEQLSLIWGLIFATCTGHLFFADKELIDSFLDGLAMVASYRQFRNPTVSTPLQEELNLEMKGLPKDATKYFRALGILYVARNLISSDRVVEGMTLLETIGAMSVDARVQLFSLVFYLMLTKIPKPPKKPWVESVLEGVKNGFGGWFNPQPAEYLRS